MSTYNVTGSESALKRLLIEVRVELDERFGGGDWNVHVEDEDVDKFVEWCEANGVEARLV